MSDGDMKWTDGQVSDWSGLTCAESVWVEGRRGGACGVLNS